MPYNAEQNEQEILKYWDEHECFKKSVESRPEKKSYFFYDGPPFATGLPHYGHILSSVIKDVVPRYWTMKGYRVRRRWGWDCHGLPIENLVEKELNVSGKKDIEEKLGVEKFNEICRSKVLAYTQEWKKMVNRIGRWIEFDNAYKTMDSTYMESVWWALQTIWRKGLIYEGRKVLLYCPRCETPVSKAEVAMDNSYKDITEEALTVKFKIKNPKKHGLPENTCLLAWTTTPWTLPGNVALAVGENIGYVVCSDASGANHYIIAEDRMKAVFAGKDYKKKRAVKGHDLFGMEYEPLFDIPAVKNSGKKAWYVAPADFVTTEEGTGIVHTAVIYGEDDYNLGVKIDLPAVPLLDEKGHFNAEAPVLICGQYFKKAEKAIKADLESRGLIFGKENHAHSYPHCWRCDTQLFYNAISAWFIDIQKIKSRLIKLNEKINWFPEHLKHGRFLNILETAPDWNISRNRYWATPLPFWRCDSSDCGQVECVGSVAELEKKAVNFSEIYDSDEIEKIDLHKHLVDKIKLRCEKCDGEMTRVPEVIDCWVESSSMPFAEFHYPFENEAVVKARLPSQYIAEYIAQTRAWFYYMHVMAVLLFDDVSFQNCVTTGTILNEEGEKLSKSRMNYPDPWKVIEQYGVDSLRYYMMTSVVMEAENLFFNEREVKETYNKVVNILWNVAEFYSMYSGDEVVLDGVAGQRKNGGSLETHNVLDKWILAKLQVLVRETTKGMDNYNTVRAGRPIQGFIDDLSTWYVRRSRDRFKGGQKSDKAAAVATLHEVLVTLSKVMAPFTPFIAERIYLALGGAKESVHLDDWPKENKKYFDEEVLNNMDIVRKVVEMGLALRSEKGIKVRQPLFRLVIERGGKLADGYLSIIADELNVKKVEIAKTEAAMAVKEDAVIRVGLDVSLTAGLIREGLAREIIRAVNQMRKEQGLTIKDRITVNYNSADEEILAVFVDYGAEIKNAVLADDLIRITGLAKKSSVIPDLELEIA